MGFQDRIIASETKKRVPKEIAARVIDAFCSLPAEMELKYERDPVFYASRDGCPFTLRAREFGTVRFEFYDLTVDHTRWNNFTARDEHSPAVMDFIDQLFRSAVDACLDRKTLVLAPHIERLGKIEQLMFGNYGRRKPTLSPAVTAALDYVRGVSGLTGPTDIILSETVSISSQRLWNVRLPADLGFLGLSGHVSARIVGGNLEGFSTTKLKLEAEASPLDDAMSRLRATAALGKHFTDEQIKALDAFALSWRTQEGL